MKHKLKFIAIITALTISLTGCFPTVEKPLTSAPSESVSDASGTSSSSQATERFSGKVYEKLGDVELNYDISADFPTQLPLIQLRQKVFDKEQVKSVLLRGKTIVPREDYADYVFYTDDDLELTVWDDEIRFEDCSTMSQLKHLGFLCLVYGTFYRAGDAQLSSFPSSEATARGNKLLDELGIENYGSPSIITISPEMANEIMDKITKGNKVTEDSYTDPDAEYIPWTEDDGLYILRYKLNFNGVDLCSSEIKTTGTSRSVKGTTVTMGVIKDRVVFFRARAVYDVVSLDAGNVDFKYDAKYVSDELIDHYSRITAVSSPICFYKCKLEYIPLKNENGDVIFTPAWCFMAYEISEEGEPLMGDKAEFFYADTGRGYGGF